MLGIAVLPKVGSHFLVSHRMKSMRSPGLSSEVPLAIVGDKKRTNSLIRIISAEVALAPVEAAELSIRAPRFEDRSTRRHGRVSQFLRQPQIFQLADVAELSSMF